MYLDYWKLQKHPFNNVPDPEMYFRGIRTIGSTVSDLLFAIEEDDESFAAVTGAAGTGKTVCLRIIRSRLDESRFETAFITNPDLTFPELLREMIAQLTGRECLEIRQDRLLDILRKQVFAARDHGKKTVILIDETNLIKAGHLDSLCDLADINEQTGGCLTVVLAGKLNLARRLEDPRNDRLFRHIGTYCRIEGIDALDTMVKYIEHRLTRAGVSSRHLFTTEAYEAIWKSADRASPRSINKVCKMSLKSGQLKGVDIIDADIVNSALERLNEYSVREDDSIKEQSAEQSALEPPVQPLKQETSPADAWSRRRNEILNSL